jgi:hypothetical protein
VSENLSTLLCAPTGPGTFDVTVTVQDATGASATASANIVIYARLTIAQFTANPSVVGLGNPVAFDVQTSGGAPGIQYSYSGLPNACLGEVSAEFSCTPTETGVFNVTVLAYDGYVVANATTALTVAASPPAKPAPPLTITAFFASPAVVTVGAMTVFEVFVEGGTPPDSIVYTGLPEGCSTSPVSELSCSPSASGSLPTTVTVTDHTGNTTSAETTLFVTPASGSAPRALAGPTWVEFGVGAAATALVVAAATFVIVRRGRPPSPGP